MTVPVQIILVPQGAEYRAVCRGLRRVAQPPVVVPVPVGPVAVTRTLTALHQQGQFANQPGVLVMGLCGGLNPNVAVGDAVLYQECAMLPHHAAERSRRSPTPDTPHPIPCDRTLTSLLQAKLTPRVTPIRAVTSDRVICTAAAKRSLAQFADVVDMEGYPVLEFLGAINIPVATLRVISDDCHHDIPDLAAAFSPDGALQPLPLALALLRQPIAATRLIQGSLQGLKALQAITTQLYQSLEVAKTLDDVHRVDEGS